MATLVILKFNNYYNRIVKKFETVEAYRGYQVATDKENVNFIPNDYINTEVVVNLDTNGVEPDYLLVVDEDENIKSRWFIISTTRLTAGQYRLELHRDLVADFYDHIITAPCFIEKATINDINDPAIFNSEQMSYNQIKQAEYPLKDKSATAWIVGYVPRDSFNQQGGTKISVKMPYEGAQDETVNQLSEYTYYAFTTEKFNSDARDVNYRVNTCVTGFNTSYDATLNLFGDGNAGPITEVAYGASRPYKYIGGWYILGNTGELIIEDKTIFDGFTPAIMEDLRALLPAFTPTEDKSTYDIIYDEDGKILYNKEDGQYYRVTVVEEGKFTETVNLNINGAMGKILYDNIKRSAFSGTPNTETFQVKFSYYRHHLELKLLENNVSTTIADNDNRYHLNDSPYDMFFIPFPAEGQTLPIYKNGVQHIASASRDAAFSIATGIALEAGKANVYDLQLLPYCPFQGIIKADGTIDIGDTLNSDITVTIGETTSAVSVLMWATTSEFKLRIPFTIPQESSVLEKKVKNETQFWRLCSPNYSGVFEFNPQKNNGVNYINIDCNYKPFNPYIHASIDFNNLYGQEFGDSRGLICGGDFSLPQTTSAWADYELNNKNYQQMLDRDIKSMEVNNAVQRERELWQITAGTLSAGASGAGAGAVALGPWGALAGLGTAGASLAGGLRDLQLNDRLRNEALDYKRDMFGYQLGNIKALPQGLAKVSAFTANNKIFPFLEQYGCTNIETQALKNKLYYNGMTIMRIGSIAEFQQSMPTYIKGRLIRLESIGEDFHIINAIADEIFKGVFI